MKLSSKSILLLVLMLLSAALGAALRPTISLADERAPMDLDAMVPTSFGDWREDVNRMAQVVNPQQKSVIDQLYSQTLSRSYINTQGYRIMLSIAYGKNQSDALQLHKPEVCYPAQGFMLLSKQAGALDLLGKPIAATRLATSLGQRLEPITYWTMVGDHNVTSGIDKKLTEMRYALDKRIPDGMLVRVSSIDPDTARAYAVQNQFANAMVEAISPANRTRFAGKLNTFQPLN
ncbi:exosortase-associated protein EpsI, B-type [Rhodoferax fermentans]|uniref:EpsI family protein n=1 Tax=Rhodoferax fermentans TaxID=28066 RepID=A0A1T1AUH9_RHOFE|nr:exosortase-associated protein EpsI, B-type [Rhodoferax fermentans]MBK1682890.1 EpsI family protein [Rhodoferax fermentans]OOV07741.1 EpsI family protein [Rhodoferax fermentans]